MSTVVARYEPNNRSFGKHMVGKEVLEAAMKAGNDVVLVAFGIAPRSEPAHKGQGDGSRYVDHFEVFPNLVVINGAPRSAATVLNDAKYAAQVEFGIGPGWENSKRPVRQGGTHGVPSRVLGRAGRVVGDYSGGVG